MTPALTRSLERVRAFIAWVMGLRPVRVFTNYSESSGLLMAAGMSYQALFASFAAVYIIFSVAGIWLVGRPEIHDALIDLINRAVPNLIGEGKAIDPAALESMGVFGWPGVIALVALLWTALGWLSFTRRAVREIFGLSRDTSAFVLLKLRELALGLGYGLLFLISAILSVLSTQALHWLFGLFHIDSASPWPTVLLRSTGLIIMFVIDTLVLASMFRVLSGILIPLRRLLAGAMLGAVAMGGLKVLGGLLLGGAGRNPLLATFAVFVGLMIWFNLTSAVTLLSASWIAVGMRDNNISARRLTREQREAEHRARVAEARVVLAEERVAAARAQVAAATGPRRLFAQRRLSKAEAAANRARDDRSVN